MTLKIPTTQEVFDRNLTNLESAIGQKSPISDKAFLRVLAAMEAMNYTELNKYGAERVLQVLALTATGDYLKIIGENYGVVYKTGVCAVLEVGIQASTGTSIPTNIYLIGDSNNLRYRVSKTAIAVADWAVIEASAMKTGVLGDLNIGDTLTIDTQFTGLLSTTAIVYGRVTKSQDSESEESYRRRVLNEIRTVGGGGNGVDYRTWAESVQGVFRAFPYAGKPISQVSLPGDRVVFIEADTDIDPNGIAPSTLLGTVRDAINTDPTTGKARPTLGDTNETLFVESIYNTLFFIQINGLEIDGAIEAETKTKIETGITDYLKLIAPYVDGCDAEITRNDVLTNLSLSLIVQDIVASVGGSIGSLGFGPTVGTFINTYTLGQGELAKLGGITYV